MRILQIVLSPDYMYMSASLAPGILLALHRCFRRYTKMTLSHIAKINVMSYRIYGMLYVLLLSCRNGIHMRFVCVSVCGCAGAEFRELLFIGERL